MRADRLLTLSLFHPVSRCRTERRPKLPILMYHSISDDREDAIPPYYRTATSPEIFAQQMQCLASLGYRATTLTAARKALAVDPAGARNIVALTFDDGFRDFYTHAFPVLQRHGFSATMYLPTAFIGDVPRPFSPSSTGARLAPGRPCLTWNEVRELRAAGIEFGSHTISHPKLVELDWPAIANELRQSRAEIELRLGAPAAAFSYPYAFPGNNKAFVDRFARELREAGYTSCATTELGRITAGHDPFRLPRLPVNSLDDPRLFRAKLEGGYDWLARPQAFVKAIKRLLASPRRNSPRTARTAGATLN